MEVFAKNEREKFVCLSHTAMRDDPRQSEVRWFCHLNVRSAHSLWWSDWTASVSEIYRRFEKNEATTLLWIRLLEVLTKNERKNSSAYRTYTCATAIVDRNCAGSGILTYGRLIRCDEACGKHQRVRYNRDFRRIKLLFFCKYALQKYLQKNERRNSLHIAHIHV